MQMADKVNFRAAVGSNVRPKPRSVRVCERDEVGEKSITAKTADMQDNANNQRG